MSIAGRAIAAYIRFVRKTGTMTSSLDDVDSFFSSHEPIITAFWHGQFLLVPTLIPKGKTARVMVARHMDAELIGQALTRFDMNLIRGAGAGSRRKDRGGARALRECLDTLESNTSVALTADVPPGPARKCGMGIITIARYSGRPIIPIAIASSRFKVFNTWSRFTINLPFSKLGFVVGEPLFVAKDADEAMCEEARQKLEQDLNRITRQAYQLAGADYVKATPATALEDQDKVPLSTTLKAYRTITTLARPFVPLLLSYRAKKGKEDLARKNERMGKPLIQRPKGHLIWLHAASVGEMNAILPVISQINTLSSHSHILLTTGTMTSAKLAKERLPANAIHQFVPLDSSKFIQSFLEHWQPDLALFTESEIWPNMVLQTSERNIPLVLLNGRMSKKSYQKWRKRSNTARALFSRFHLTLTQNARLAERFTLLGARKALAVGNLKADAPALPVNELELTKLKNAIGDRKVFIAASTHHGEDLVIAKAHKILKNRIPDLLTIIAPRHPERAANILEQIKSFDPSLAVRQRSKQELPEAQTDIYLADTIGELGTLYSLAPLTFIGGSLVDKGGQNPLEAVRLGAGILTGPDMTNFHDEYHELLRLGGAQKVTSAENLADMVFDLLTSPEKLAEMQLKGKQALENLSGALPKTLDALKPFLPLPAPESPIENQGLQRAS